MSSCAGGAGLRRSAGIDTQEAEDGRMHSMAEEGACTPWQRMGAYTPWQRRAHALVHERLRLQPTPEGQPAPRSWAARAGATQVQHILSECSGMLLATRVRHVLSECSGMLLATRVRHVLSECSGMLLATGVYQHQHARTSPLKR